MSDQVPRQNQGTPNVVGTFGSSIKAGVTSNDAPYVALFFNNTLDDSVGVGLEYDATGADKSLYINNPVGALQFSLARGMILPRLSSTDRDNLHVPGVDDVPFGTFFFNLDLQRLQFQATPGTNSIAWWTLGGVMVDVPYSASMTPDCLLGDWFRISATNAVAFTINAPTNRRSAQVNSVTFGDCITITIRNTTGGALGAITMNAVYKLSGGAFPSPGANSSRSVTFRDDHTNWVEVSRTPADVPN